MNQFDFEENFKPLFTFWDEHIRRVGQRMGFDPYPPDYRFASAKEIISTYPYVGLPVYPGTWNNGKEFLRYMYKFNLPDGHPEKEHAAYELIIRTNPVVTYMQEEAYMALHSLIIGHANVGHSHFYKNNHSFTGIAAEEVLERLSQYAQRLEQLKNDPEFGVRRLEWTADAAWVIAKYNREHSENLIPEKELRERLEVELRRVQAMRKKAGERHRLQPGGARPAGEGDWRAPEARPDQPPTRHRLLHPR